MIEFFQNAVWADWLGFIGVFLYIGSYFSLQAGLIRGRGYLYASLITTAASCVLLSLLENFNLSSAIIQVTYICISVFGMIRFYIMTHRVYFNDDERAFIDSVAPNMTELQARRLLDLSVCNPAVAGVLLTEEESEPENLYFLLEGAAAVEVKGTEVAKLGPKSLVGEMSCLTGMSASATVRLTEHSRIISINLPKLNEFLKRNEDIRHELQAHFAVQVTQKLILANSALSSQG